MSSPFLFALVLTLLAGLSTGIGSAIAFFARRTNTKFLSTALGFSAGVMVYVSFVELFPQALEQVAAGGAARPALSVVLAFFAGIAFIFLIDMLIPSGENPHEVHLVEELAQRDTAPQLQRTGVLMALAIAIHNFPEGIATFTSAYVDPTIAIPIAVAIAIHNIPEGIAVRAGGRADRLFPAATLHYALLAGAGHGGRGGHHGVHLGGRTHPCRRAVRLPPLLHRGLRGRHGGHGGQPAGDIMEFSTRNNTD